MADAIQKNLGIRFRELTHSHRVPIIRDLVSNYKSEFLKFNGGEILDEMEYGDLFVGQRVIYKDAFNYSRVGYVTHFHKLNNQVRPVVLDEIKNWFNRPDFRQVTSHDSGYVNLSYTKICDEHIKYLNGLFQNLTDTIKSVTLVSMARTIESAKAHLEGAQSLGFNMKNRKNEIEGLENKLNDLMKKNNIAGIST